MTRRTEPPAWSWLGRVPYGEALERQRAYRKRVLAGEAPEALWLLEHPPVLTTGRRQPEGLPSAEALAALGIARFETERGGLATWHGPGQLVVYAFVDAWGRRMGARGLVAALEQGVIDWLAERGLRADRRCGYPGVWVGRDKLCAVGLHLERGVSMHGLALNLDPDLSAYALFTPCGITDGGVTSLARLAGSAPSPENAAPGLAQALVAALQDALDPVEGCARPGPLGAAPGGGADPG